MTLRTRSNSSLPGQFQSNETDRLTFAAPLRAFLRQDPNIILVGEFADFEMPEIAVKRR